jgi:hypothetical protein
MNDEKEKDTIGMLLDIEHLYGEHEGRLGPVLATMGICVAPVLFYIYFGWYGIIPIWLAIPIELFICIRTIMIIQGRERYRKKAFLNMLNSNYTNAAKLLNVKVIHPDGCIEYINGKVGYLVCCFNGTTSDEVMRSVQLRKFLENMLNDYDYDTYIQNVNDSPTLRDYYNKVSNFGHNDSAKNFIGIIDHSIELTADTSKVQCTIYMIKGYKSDWKSIKTSIDSALKSRTAKCYKTVYRVSEPDIVNDILNRDIDSIINLSDLTRRKYATQQFDTSKVLAYDLPDDKEIIQGKSAAKPVIVEEPPKKSFHVSYKENG